MRILLGSISTFALVFGSGLVASAATAPTVVPASAVAFKSGTGESAGTQVAVLAGDPSKAGPYTMRLKLPAGFAFAPHSHGEAERVTVMSGTMLVGLGPKVEPAKMKTLAAGSFAIMPAGLVHYAKASTATVLQIDGNGPATTHMMDHKM